MLINLKCPNCGANLEISPEMMTFACGYCGASQMVERTGGTIALRLLNDSINRVQIGTDKTAAELAIRRLKEEYQQIEVAYQNSGFVFQNELRAVKSNFKNLWIILSVLSFFMLFGGFWVALTVIVIWCSGSGVIWHFYSNKKSEAIAAGRAVANGYQHQFNDLNKKIAIQKQIVDS